MLTELRDKRNTYIATSKKILEGAEGRSLTVAETKDFDGLLLKVKDINSTLERSAILNEVRDGIDHPPVNTPARAADANAMTYTHRSSDPREVRTYKPGEAIAEAPYGGAGLGSYVRGIVTGRWDGAEELRALAEGGTPGSYLIPTPLATYLIDQVRNQAQVLKAGATTVPMTSATLKIARQTADVTAAWKSENAAISFSDANFDVLTFTSQMLVAASKLSIEVAEDAYGLDAIVSNSFVKSLALKLDYGCLYGSGVAPEIKGIRNQPGVTVTDLGVNGLALTDFSKFSSAIAGLMGNNYVGPFGGIYSARTAGVLDNLQDTLHQPLRQPDSVAAMRKFVSNQVPNNLTKGTSNLSTDAILGDFSQCLIAIRTGLVLEVSREAGDASGGAFSQGQIWVRGYMRADCQLAHANAFTVLNGIL